MMPLAAWTSPIANIRPAYFTSSLESRAATPRSIARPITAGITACALIQAIPKSIPITRVRHCPFAIHHSSRPADRWSAIAGMVEGQDAHRLTLGIRGIPTRLVFRCPLRASPRASWALTGAGHRRLLAGRTGETEKEVRR